MTKAMTPEIKEATIGEFIMAEDLLNSPIKLRLTAVELQKEEVEANSGKMMDKVIFYFINNKKQEKQIGVLSFDSLVRQMNVLDPDIGDVLQLETIEIQGSKYLVWKVEVAQQYKGDTPARKVEDNGEVAKEKLPTETDRKGGLSKEEEAEILAELPF